VGRPGPPGSSGPPDVAGFEPATSADFRR